ncbi:MAG TPA: enoyl-CoA hydratase-related protein [Bacteroidia bacterium]|nr:enoyl-CoA hydratase-related protein [Bacteroidia bacterium]
MANNLIIQSENGIRIITINRPDKLNALNRETLSELDAAMNDAISTTEIFGIIITGSGEKAFVAGADISEFSGLNPDDGKKLSAFGQNIFKKIELSPKPVIAAVNGFALGGGCELAMACHLRIASDNAKFGQPEVKLGLIPGYGGTQRLVHLIGKGRATELLMTAGMINSQQALEIGLVNYVTRQDELIPKCKELLEKIRQNSPYAISAIIRSVDACFNSSVDGFKTEVEEFGKCFAADDVKEGTRAFTEKRKPEFKNLIST